MLILWMLSDVEQGTDIQAHIAQSVERVLGKDEVTGSSPVAGSIFWKFPYNYGF